MPAAPLRPNEAQSLASLERLGVMDSQTEPAFDALVRAASLVCGVPISLISLIDADRQWFKANEGLNGVTQTPRDVAFCAHAVLGTEVFEVSDATQDARFSQNPLVLGDPSIRFYAGMPLKLGDGSRIGTLCVIDRKPRHLTHQQREILGYLAAAAAQLLEGRRALKVVTEAEAALKALNDRIAVATDSGRIGVWEYDIKTRISKWDGWVYKLFGLPPETRPEVSEEVWAQRIAPEGLSVVRQSVKNAIEGISDFNVEYPVIWPDGSRHVLHSSARLLKDTRGKPVGLIGANRDITEQHRVDGVLRRQRLVATVQAGAAVAANEAKTLNGAMQTCVNLICTQTGWAVGHVYLPSGERLVPGDLWSAGAREKYPAFCQETSRTTFAAGEGLIGAVMRERAPLYLETLSGPPFVRRASAAASGLTWGVAAPVLVGDEVAAVIEFFSGLNEPFDSSLLELLSYAGLQLGRVVDRERAHASLQQQTVTLRQQSIVDELTGLYNRRGFLELAAERMTAAARTSQRSFLVFADLDGMKRINDELGHEVGDAALVAAAGVLRRTLRSLDIVARLGGDEFVALTCETGVFDADALVRRLEGEVAKVNAEATLGFRLAISFGVSAPAGENEPIQDVLKRADEAMYQKKQQRKAAAR